MKIPEFKTKKELFDFLVENKEQLENAKKAITKEADGFAASLSIARDFDSVGKAASEQTPLIDKEVLDVVAVINTTNIMDSHKDVHIPGLWDKSLSENKRLMHVQEHKTREFDKIISSGDDLKAYTKNYTWRELGYNAVGKTQALVFESKVKKSRNAFMHEQYAKGYVDNHSVGMRYVKLVLCINDDDYGAEKEAWDKYFPEVINSEEAEKYGYFWAVTEAKAIEGSAVPQGSNFVTPTTQVKGQPEGTKTKELTPKMKAIYKFLNIEQPQ